MPYEKEILMFKNIYHFWIPLCTKVAHMDNIAAFISVPANQRLYDSESAGASRACPWGLSWLSKQTKQQQAKTDCHQRCIRPALNQGKPQDV